MALVLEDSGIIEDTTSSFTITFTVNIPTGSNLFFCHFDHYNNNGITVWLTGDTDPSTVGGDDIVQVGNQIAPAAAGNGGFAGYVIDPDIGASITVTIQLSDTQANEKQLHWYVFSGADDTNPVNAFDDWTRESITTANDSLTTTVDDCFLITAIHDNTGPTNGSISGFTQLQVDGTSGGTIDYSESWYLDGAGTAGAESSAWTEGQTNDVTHAMWAIAPADTGGGRTVTAAHTLAVPTQAAVLDNSVEGATPDIGVQRGTATAANTGGTTSPGTDFGSLASTIVMNSNNRRMHGGRDDENAANAEGDDMSGGIHLSAVDTIDLDRESGSIASVMRFAWEAWEYEGAASGDNEFIVRGRVKLSLTGETTTTTISNITDIDRCIPFITGLLTDETTDGADASTAIAWLSSTDTLNIRRGGTNGTVDVYVTVVEFTGTNWSVFHGRQEGDTTDAGSITLVDDADGETAGGGDVTDWGTAVIFHQHCANNLGGTDDAISDNSAIYEPGANTTTVDYEHDANHADAATAGNRDEHFVHVLQHDDMDVTRFSTTDSGAGATNVDITSAGLTDLARSAIEVSRYSSGSGTAYGRGWVNGRLTSLTNFEQWVHRSGNNVDTRIQIIDLSSVATAAAGADRTVTAAQTLAVPTQSADAALIGKVTSTQSLAVPVQAVALKNIAKAAADHSLAVPTQAAELTGVISSDVTADHTLAVPTQSAAVDLISKVTSAQALAAPTQAASIGAIVKASAAQSLAVPTQSADLGTIIKTVADHALAVPTQAALAKVIGKATAAQTLAAPTQAANLITQTGIVAAHVLAVPTQAAALASIVKATADQSLAAPVQSAAVAAISKVAAAQSLAAPIQAATLGQVGGVTADHVLAVPTQSATAKAIIKATSAASLLVPVQAASIETVVKAIGASVLAVPTQAAAAKVIDKLVANQALAVPIQAAVIRTEAGIAAAHVLAAPTQAATAAVIVKTVAAGVLAVPEQVASIKAIIKASAAQSLAVPTQTAVLGVAATGLVADHVLSAPTQSADAQVIVKTAAAGTLAAPQQAAAAKVVIKTSAGHSLAVPSQSAALALVATGITADHQLVTPVQSANARLISKLDGSNALSVPTQESALTVQNTLVATHGLATATQSASLLVGERAAIELSGCAEDLRTVSGSKHAAYVLQGSTPEGA